MSRLHNPQRSERELKRSERKLKRRAGSCFLILIDLYRRDLDRFFILHLNKEAKLGRDIGYGY